ncbi:MAG: SpoIIE family protein phosphatase [Acidimicrobiaceae bacterium]|nr:SpoIIE family protein phosphatase [Acidimicrobiaceae bacterium]MCY4174886.1 SpoIIE family protein phosphatase [Acidimicrobiaceae bacterium]MCY4280365.1 SpoIIE family protein phosphatase [Acidimicrobiaceae bacterium]MCY4294455.1 SpoIIE family protein phosphatase [Acidimicrobiaceae bacterium]
MTDNNSQHKHKILVVDDEPDLEPLMLQRMRRYIRTGMYEFVFAHDGVEALQALDEDKGIDMVLSDINMPKMDGLTLLQRIPDVAPDIRAVIISAYGDMKNIRIAMNRGAFDFVTKPVDFDDLKFTIDRTLQHIREWKDALSARDKLVVLQNELNVASMMQQSILPNKFSRNENYRLFGTMQPARNVGGDFFDVIGLPDDKVGLAIADVSGKGVPAALFMMSSRTLLKSAAIRADDPGDALSEVNEVLNEDNDACMFVTMIYAVYDPRTNVFSYSNGGHDAPVVVHADGSTTQLPVTEGLALGVLPDFEFSHLSYELQPGESIVLYTDGVTEAINADEEQLGLARLREAFAANPPTDAEDAGRRVINLVNDFAGDVPQFDDTTCLVIRRES